MVTRDSREEVIPIDGNIVLPRWKASQSGRILPLVCATLPILRKGKIVELLRHKDKKVLGGEWVPFLSEHVKPRDNSDLNAIRRGAKEELGYFPLISAVYNPKDSMNIAYISEENNILYWRASLFVIPIRSIKQLTPDLTEIVDIRERNIDELFREIKKKDSIYSRFWPREFLVKLEQYTREIERD